VFVPGIPFLTSLMRVKQLYGRLLPLPTNIRVGGKKHSSLLRRIVNYDLKKFRNIGPRFHSVTILTSVIMLNVIMLSVTMLNVVVPYELTYFHSKTATVTFTLKLFMAVTLAVL
jgi:hypothetical protein